MERVVFISYPLLELHNNKMMMCPGIGSDVCPVEIMHMCVGAQLRATPTEVIRTLACSP